MPNTPMPSNPSPNFPSEMEGPESFRPKLSLSRKDDGWNLICRCINDVGNLNRRPKAKPAIPTYGGEGADTTRTRHRFSPHAKLVLMPVKTRVVFGWM